MVLVLDCSKTLWVLDSGSCIFRAKFVNVGFFQCLVLDAFGSRIFKIIFELSVGIPWTLWVRDNPHLNLCFLGSFSLTLWVRGTLR